MNFRLAAMAVGVFTLFATPSAPSAHASGGPSSDCIPPFGDIDANNDGGISLDEAAAAAPILFLHFQSVDMDQNQLIDEAEHEYAVNTIVCL